MKHRYPTRIIGWKEWVKLPDLGVSQIKAKIDTGARTSAIHAFDIKEVDIDGVPHVSFDLHPVQRKKKPTVKCVCEIKEKRIIKSSNGISQARYVIKTRITIGTLTFPVEVTLTNRDEMNFRMLLGRQALKGRYLVDSAAAHLTD